MPCNRRMKHCGGLRFHPYGGDPRMHPLFAAMMNEFTGAEEEEEEQVAAAIFGKDKARWNETETNFTFQMDVPGVRPHQVTIEEKDGEIEVSAIRMKGQEVAKTYQDVFYVRPSKADLSNVLATLDEGVLTILVPKKNQEPMVVPVKQEPAPAVAADGKEFRFTMDLPGVRAANLQVQVLDHKVILEASRNVGDRVIRIHRVLPMEESKADMTKALVFLQNGVFTIVAPISQDEQDDNSKQGALRTIYVQEEIAAMESLSLEENEQKEEGDMVVETVTEGEQDWEEVNQKDKEENSIDKEE